MKEQRSRNRQVLLLQKELGGSWEGIEESKIPKILNAMTIFAYEARERAMNKELNDEYISFFKLLFHANYENKILWMRFQKYKLAVKEAILRMETEGYKMYVVRISRTGYRVMSTLDFKYNQSVKIMKRNVTFKDLEKIAALCIFQNGAISGKGFSSGSEVDEWTKKTVSNWQKKKKRTLQKHKR